MTAFILLVVVIREAVREGLGLATILRIVPYVFPVSMRLSIPTAALLAATVVYGRISADNELVAIKSMGVSPMVVVVPSLIIAFLISLGAVAVNDAAVWWGKPGLRRVVLASVKDIAYGMLRTRGSYSNSRFSIIVRQVDGDRLIMPRLTLHGDHGDEDLVISAKEARLRSREDNHSLTIELIDSIIEGPDNVEGANPQTMEREISLDQDEKSGNKSASDYALHELPLEAERQSKRIDKLGRTLAAQASFDIITGNLHRFNGSTWRARQTDLDASHYRLNRLRLEPWRRWANGFSCLAFAIIGVPISLRLRNSDFITSFFVCFLPILVLYYPLFEVGVGRAKQGDLPPYAVWIGNLICLAVGLMILRRVTRY